jgi:pyruvate/2-oxoglutarate dehydrogenase complex dihydrolipoamide acyltransferase (E2) component
VTYAPAADGSFRERLVSKPATGRARLILSQLIEQFAMPNAPGTVLPYPRLRNFILDVMAEGRRKNILHVLVEADVSDVKERLAEHRRRTGEAVSITSYVAASYVAAIAADKAMQAYRKGRRKLVVFDDIDLTFTIERDFEGAALPVFKIVRAAQEKSAAGIHSELQAAKNAPLGMHGPMTALDMLFFRLPRLVRRSIWFFVRRNPYWFKDLAGTVGITSMGMFTQGAAVAIPITPMTLTLAIGGIDKKLVLQDGNPVEREVIHLNLSADHDVVDGAPLMRFANRLKAILRDGTVLAEASRCDASPAPRSP